MGIETFWEGISGKIVLYPFWKGVCYKMNVIVLD